MSLMSNRLEYLEHGDPVKVVAQKSIPLQEPKDGEVLVEMIAAPVNPADINTIQGKYPVRPPLPSVPGNEGVAKVLRIGTNVKSVKEGDRVVPLSSGLGTWQSHAVYRADQLLQIPSDLGVVEAATLTVNPCTAYRMLRDFKDLKAGDCVIQNGANSACGQNVIQLCKIWGIQNVAIVRDRPEIDQLKEFLTKMGATLVLTEQELRVTTMFKEKKLPRPTLALNCVGGKIALEMVRHLEHGAVMVTYGGMSREPVTIPTSALIFKDLAVKGFWMTHWSKTNNDSPQKIAMFNEIIDYMRSGKLGGPAYKMVPFQNYTEALMNTMTIQGFTGKKYLLDFTS
uniref:Enoyl-[acyl-carrier-protein] reductase, mitochondrial n=1 Tax=Xenopsylla cheopis TaxID=163159 RepID=A0A6M2DJZ0_XENCH